MKKIILSSAILIILSMTIQAQEKSVNESNQTQIIKKDVNYTQSIGNQILFRNESLNPILTITDEGNNAASITFPPLSSIDSSSGKLYNFSGDLYWNGSALGSSGAAAINDLNDAIYDGSSLFLGNGSGLSDDGDNSITAVGKSALYSNTSGHTNTAIGLEALYSNKTGYWITAIGNDALYSSVALVGGVAVGHESQKYIKSVYVGDMNYNTSVGNQSLRGSTSPDNNTGNFNSAFGYQALLSNTTGRLNTANGFVALVSNTEGLGNTAIGSYTLNSNKTGNYNTANGCYALTLNTGDNNTANGFEALYNNKGGSNNSVIGYRALYSNSDGDENIAIGVSTLLNNISGRENVAIGNNALDQNQTGSWNIAIGKYASNRNIDGQGNTCIGYSSHILNEHGNNNTIIGYEAGGGLDIRNSSGNIFLGYQAGLDEIGSNLLYIENSSSNTPLIWGDFSTDNVIINGNLEVTGIFKDKGYIKLTDTKSSGTSGGTFTSGVWQTRDINTVDDDTQNLVNISSNQITLPAGTYYCKISCPAYNVTRHKTRLQNITDGITEIFGTSEFCWKGNNIQTRSVISGLFTISTESILEIQHRCEITTLTTGFGVESDFGIDEVYTIAEFWRKN